ncbi:alpha-amylase family protein [Mucisphaera calidilacus]|uniref:Beta-galactosidase GanA n=1 Tax=Mucisphaera calidilacus TaxID=2527982 RepID=A0A518BU51_9BACT|nr:alpha-amylase family protein [Mucisphaera calidilacus]QDU70523.1 Beta-galactosidase GanA [Mucisphaera calidilacus]
MKLSYRHIHLDFHTSPDIEGIGADFDPADFARTLKQAHVSSINLFARCHHGYVYYPSKVNPERIHPHLERPNLLPEQIEACHKQGIRAPIYITVQWDQFTSDEHRDWLLIDENAKPYGNGPMEAGFYRRLDVSHPSYIEFLENHVREVLATMPVDGLWFDIVVPYFSYAKHWLDAMDREGLDVERAEDRTRYSREVIRRFKSRMTEFVRSLPEYNEDCTIFYNAGHVGPRHRDCKEAYTHFELESLPGGGWGYMHFPVAQRYARGLGLPTLGMTGKFHSSWGDFHGYKNEASLEFEVFNMLALGATTCIGDQLPPRGVLDPTTYELIGGVFEQIEEKEPWCHDASPVTDIAVMIPEEFQRGEGVFHDQEESQGRTDFGVVRMLQELGHQFDMVSSDRDFSPYKLVVLPDEIPVSPELAKKLKAYVAQGGSLLLSHRSGLTPEGDAFADLGLNATLVGEAPFCPDFLRPEAPLREGLADTRYVMIQTAMEVKPEAGAEVLARTERPYFNRTREHFCSHQYAPTSGEFVYPSVIRSGSVIYFAHPVFRMYDYEACRWVKRLVRNAIDLLMPTRLVRHDGPSSLIATLNEQSDQQRLVLHLQHYIPERRGERFDVVEDKIPLYNRTFTLTPDRAVKSARLVPQDQPLEITQVDTTIAMTVPVIDGHQMVELNYA